MNENKLTLHVSSKPYVNKIRSLLNLTEKTMKGKTFSTNDDLRNIILVQITAAANRIVGSLLAQIDNNSFYNTELLLRPLVEGLINLKYIKEDATQMRARAFVADEKKDKLKNIKKLIDFYKKSDAQEVREKIDIEEYTKLNKKLEKEYQELKDKYRRENLNFLTLFERAKRSNTEGLYATAYWLFSQEAHLTAKGLDRFMTNNNGQLTVTSNLDLHRFNLSLHTTYVVYLALLNECSETFGIPSREDLDEFPDTL